MSDGQTYTINGQRYEMLCEQSDSGASYDWSAVGLMRRKDGQLFYVYDGGCSCNWFMDDPESVELTPVATWAEAVDKLRADLPYNFSDNDAMQFAENLNKLRPAPSPK